MNRKPIIGIPTAAHSLDPVLPIYGNTCHYPEAVLKAGGIPVQLPIPAGAEDSHLQLLVQHCDGFLLPGGPDFDSCWYGETLLPGLEPDSGALDLDSQEAALRFVRLAAASGKPILGVCLGMQVLNVALGGSLIQDIPTQCPSPIPHRNPMNVTSDRWHIAHSIRTAEGSLIRSICTETTPVNSFHHQAVRQSAPGFRITAWAEDGIAEAMESEQRTMLAVQWHPENLSHIGDSASEALFRWLTEAACR